MTDSTDIVERLRTARDDDHERGCQMRFALCSCGFDDKCARTAGEAADTIKALREQLAEARAAFKHFGEHRRYCAKSRLTIEECDCGFSAALTKLETPDGQ